MSNTKAKKVKSQAAMEFLMTYGWALLIVLLAISALTYFGILNPGRFLPDKVDLVTKLVVVNSNVNVDDKAVNLYVKNIYSSKIRDLTIKCGSTGVTSFPIDIGPNAVKKIVINCLMSENSKISEELIGSYAQKTAGNFLDHTFRGKIIMKTTGLECNTDANGFNGGDGTSGNPYQICNCVQLQNMNTELTSYFDLIKDIDCTYETQHPEGALYNGGFGFLPIN